MKNRVYSFKDVDMLLASRTIASHFKANLPELAALRTNWNEEYADMLSARIDSAIDACLGMDKKKELKEATEELYTIQTLVMKDLSFLKNQILVDHPGEAKKMLARLGYTKYETRIKYKDQEGLIEMLHMFNREMNDNLKTKICSRGIDPQIIERILEYTSQMKELETKQETLKKSSKQLTAGVIEILNEIYREVSGICRIVWSFFQSQPLKQEQFSFSGIVKNMNKIKPIL
ncbi:MAG: hypothetical protein JXN62_00535 [Bacteroidales bacterium]|nr:hypothetical protein [Bacteroidales bacterium]